MDNWKIQQTADLNANPSSSKWFGALMLIGDSNAHTWEVAVKRGNSDVSLTGGSVTGYFRRKDDVTVIVTGEVEGNIARVTLPQACYAYQGNLTGIMRLTMGDDIMTLAMQVFTVSSVVTDQIADPTNLIPSLEDLLVKIETMEQKTADANTAISSANTATAGANTAASAANAATSAATAGEAARNVFQAWSAATAYVPGNKVADAGSSYLCIAPNTNQRPPNATYWLLIAAKGDNTTAAAVSTSDASNVQAKLDAHTSQLAETTATDPTNLFDITKITADTSINSSGAEQANPGKQSSTFFPVMAGQAYRYSEAGIVRSLLVAAFYSAASAGAYISRVTSIDNTDLQNGRFTPPAGATYCRVTKDGTFPATAKIEAGYVPTPYRGRRLQDIVGNGIVRAANIDSRMRLGAARKFRVPMVLATGYISEAGALVSSAGWYNGAVPGSGGDVFFFTGVMLGSAKYPMAVFYNGSTGIGTNGIASTNPQTVYQDFEVIVPPGATKVVFNFYESGYVKKLTPRYKPQPIGRDFIGHRSVPGMGADYQHIIFYGQSLSVGADSKYVADPELPGNYMLGTLTTPSATLPALKLTSNGQHPVVSAVNSFGELFRRYVTDDVEFVAGSYGAGGMSIAQLMSAARQAVIKIEGSYAYDCDSSGRYDVFLSALTYGKSMADAAGKTIGCPAIVFLQGERDYYTDAELIAAGASSPHAFACGEDKAKYKLYMSRLKADMQAAVMAAYGQDIAPIFCIYQVSGSFVENASMTINMAQIEFAAENDDVVLLQSPYALPDYTNVHLSTNGYRWYGEYIAKALFGALVQRRQQAPMLPAAYLMDANSIRIKISNAVLPLVIDTYTTAAVANNGFSLLVDGSAATITGVSVYGDEIIITTSANLSTATTVELAYAGLASGGTGNIRDSDRYQAMYSYWDDSADTGASGTLSIAYRPLDAAGASIVGKKYPMQNWLQSFYRQIK